MSRHGEHKLRNRIVYKLTGRWPRSVVDSRLANMTADLTNAHIVVRGFYDKPERSRR